MLYLGIDLHRKQITVCLRDQQGEMLVRRQVSTRPKKIEAFLQQLHELAGDDGYTALLEVCGFEEWLVLRLEREVACRDVILIQPEKPSKKKTDRRDAAALSELLWVNRERLLDGKKVHGVRQVLFPSEDDRQDRQVTASRRNLTDSRTKTLNRIHFLLRKNNLEWEYPTKTFQTKKGRAWLESVELKQTDRLEMDLLLEQWELWDRQLEQLDTRIEQRAEGNPDARLLMTIIGMRYYMALAIVSRIGDISRFPCPRSLANFFGLTPGSRNTGDTERLGSITKQGSRMVRFLLGQLVVHVLRRDGRMRTWYKGIKKRRGAKIARVAVMRRLCVILWHMLKHREAYRYGGEPVGARGPSDDPSLACATDVGKIKTDYVAELLEVSSARETGLVS
jgi:transposase